LPQSSKSEPFDQLLRPWRSPLAGGQAQQPSFLVPEDPPSADSDSGGETPELELAPVPPPPRFSEIPRLERYRFHSAILPEPYERCVSVYLPKAYFSDRDRRFPVFYLHDGQNLFDDLTSYVPGHSWRAHTTADRLSDSGEIEPVILVGIANTGLRRMAEYTPTRDFKLGGGEARSYARLLIEELKPQIDREYRTEPGPANTAAGGSSLGGLVSLFLGFEYPEVFGKIAVMSPSIWWNSRSILSFVEAPFTRPNLRIWLDIGMSEGAKHLRDTDHLFRLLKRRGWREHIDLAYQRVPGGVHSEDAWAARFDDVLRFLFPAA
jgi:predicted alpha/beta superfamily hydrolase